MKHPFPFRVFRSRRVEPDQVEDIIVWARSAKISYRDFIASDFDIWSFANYADAFECALRFGGSISDRNTVNRSLRQGLVVPVE